uniref:Uncharacterized protein n=1 Tax=Anguilla anguilla TaxID=7936 RepID=A0A0E9X449_ANGAN
MTVKKEKKGNKDKVKFSLSYITSLGLGTISYKTSVSKYNSSTVQKASLHSNHCQLHSNIFHYIVYNLK